MEIDNEKVNELYRLAHYMCKKMHTKYDEDLGQELVMSVVEKQSLFDESKSSWLTFVTMIMRFTLLHMFRYQSKHDVPTISLDRKVKDNEDGDSIDMYNLFPSKEDVKGDILTEELIDKITPLVKEPLGLWINGTSQKEIAAKLNTTQANVSRIIRKNINEIREYCKDNGLM